MAQTADLAGHTQAGNESMHKASSNVIQPILITSNFGASTPSLKPQLYGDFNTQFRYKGLSL